MTTCRPHLASELGTSCETQQLDEGRHAISRPQRLSNPESSSRNRALSDNLSVPDLDCYSRSHIRSCLPTISTRTCILTLRRCLMPIVQAPEIAGSVCPRQYNMSA